MMNPVEMIARKRDGLTLSGEEIKWFIQAYTKGIIQDYQVGAMLMAIYFQGMTSEELSELTLAMIASGRSLNWEFPGVYVDKHSTGGVGDKVSLILAPLVAAAGVSVPMMSGRGLGHTGGTLDKLEAIPGFRIHLTDAEMKAEMEQLGYIMIGQSEDMVPADRKMYALRDVTATVSSIPLICASILSKKKAEGANALVLDVKCGKGAFLDSQEKTEELARTLVTLGNQLGMETVAILTAMDEPLGNTVGNWLETQESIEALHGNGPEDLMEIVMALGAQMLVSGKKADSLEEGEKQLAEILKSGEGLKRFRDMVAFQGGDVSLIDHPERYPASQYEDQWLSPESGFISEIDAFEVGMAAIELGAGRMTKDDVLDYGAGFILNHKTGAFVEKGSPLVIIRTNKKEAIPTVKQRLMKAFKFQDQEKPESPLILKRIISPA